MPKKDFFQTAFDVVQKSTEKEKPKNAAAVALGRLGGLKGGKARADKLTSEQKSEIAKKGAAKRWEKAKANPK